MPIFWNLLHTLTVLSTNVFTSSLLVVRIGVLAFGIYPLISREVIAVLVCEGFDMSTLKIS